MQGSNRIAKHFVTVGTRRVHYLRAGVGPPLVLLHASACSAKVMRPLIHVFAREFTVLAFDNPGFGLSDPLALPTPTIADLADALAATLDALGIEQVACYGRHTGASIAVEFAVRHPARCAMVLTDGYAMLSGDYDESKIDEYLRPIQPSWDGTHLVWLWFRYREQHVFWPWNAPSLERRAQADVPDLDYLHRGVLEFLEAGNNYRLGYAAAFRYNAIEAFGRLTVPVCFGTRPGDWMHQMAGLVPQSAWREVLPRDAAAAAEQELTLLRRHRASGTVPSAPRCAPIAGRSTVDYVVVHGLSMLVRRSGDDTLTTPILICPHAPGSSASYEPLLAALAPHRAVLAIDYPGHGESDPWPNEPHGVAQWAEAVTGALDALGIAKVHAYGHAGGAAVAVECARRFPQRVESLILDAPIRLTEAARSALAPRYAQSITPTWDGGHLLRLWHHLRDSELWWPWFERGHQNIRTTPPRIDPARLTALACEALKQPASYQPAWEAVLSYPLDEQLATMTTPYTLIAAAEDTFAHTVPSAQPVHDDPRSRADAIIAAIAEVEKN